MKAFSNDVFNAPIDPAKLKSPNQTHLKIYKIIRQDGKMIKRSDIKGVDQ